MKRLDLLLHLAHIASFAYSRRHAMTDKWFNNTTWEFAANAEGIDVEVEISTEGAWESACVNVWLAQRGAPTFFLDAEQTRLMANINRNEASDLARSSLVAQIDLARLTIPPVAPNP